MNKPTFWLLLTLLGVLVAEDATSQRRRFGGQRSRSEPEQAEPEKDEAAEDDEVERWLAITGGNVHLGTGQVMRRATVLLGDDEIHAVGHDLEIPEDAETLDASGKVVCPGFVIPHASGMGAPRSGDAGDGVNPFDPSIVQGLAAGITTFMTGRPGRGHAPGGTTSVIKLARGDLDGMVLARGTVLGMRVPLSPQQLDQLEQALKKAREYREKKEAHAEAVQKDPKAKAPKKPRGIDDLLKVLDGKARLWISGADSNSEIRQAMEIAAMLEVGVVLDGSTTAWSLPAAIAATGSMVILDPRERRRPDPAHPGHTGSNLAAAAILAEAGVPVAVKPPRGRFGGAGLGTNGILGQDLNTPHIDAAFAVRGGLDNRKALRTITLDSARAIGVDVRVGSLAPGKDADVLILDGDPLHYETFVLTALVNGKVVYEKDKEPLYSHIRR